MTTASRARALRILRTFPKSVRLLIDQHAPGDPDWSTAGDLVVWGCGVPSVMIGVYVEPTGGKKFILGYTEGHAAGIVAHKHSNDIQDIRAAFETYRVHSL